MDLAGRKILPVGNSSFASVARNNVFVDKSLLIADLLESGFQATLFCRPRRFGKSLNLSMLKSFFEMPVDGGPSCRELFEPLSIWSASDGAYRTEQGAYPVIRLGLNTAKGDTWDQVYESIRAVVQAEYARHDYLLRTEGLSEADRAFFQTIVAGTASASEVVASLVRLESLLSRYHSAPVVLLIDEYDAPVMASYSHGFYQEAVSFIKRFLTGALKDNDGLRLAVLTGVQRISKESIFSDLNNLSVNTSLSPLFDAYFGFTPREVEALARYRDCPGCLGEMREWYDGYRFGANEIYNPWSVLSYLAAGCAPDAYWVNTSSNEVVASLVDGSSTRALGTVFNLLRQGETFAMNLDLSVVFPDVPVSGDALWSMLYLAGYVTTDDTGYQNDAGMMRRLRIPNREIARVFANEVVSRFSALSGGRSDLLSFQAALRQGDTERVARFLERFLVSCTSYYDLSSENSYHMMLMGLCFGMPGYEMPRSNREAGDGRSDIQILPAARVRHAVGVASTPAAVPLITIEVKHAAKGAIDLDGLALDALAQIAARRYDVADDAGPADRVRWGIAFDGKHVAVACERV